MFGEHFRHTHNNVRNNSTSSQSNVNIAGPVVVPNGGTGQFCYSFPTGLSTFPIGNNGKYRVTFTLPADFSFSGNPADFTFTKGAATWPPSSLTQVGNQVIAEYSFPNPLGSVTNSEICIHLTNTCGTGGSKTLNFYMEVVNNSSMACPCTSKVQCNRSFTFSSGCPVPCATGGASMYDFSMKRTNLGFADADDNGVADAGHYDMSLVRLGRAMVGDTVRQTVKTAVLSGTSSTDWSHLYFRTTIVRASTIDLINIAQTATIYDVSTGNSYICTPTLVSMTNSGTSRIYLYLLDSTSMVNSGCVPAGFKFENSDSV